MRVLVLKFFLLYTGYHNIKILHLKTVNQIALL